MYGRSVLNGYKSEEKKRRRDETIENLYVYIKHVYKNIYVYTHKCIYI